jgi:translation initiation factor 1
MALYFCQVNKKKKGSSLSDLGGLVYSTGTVSHFFEEQEQESLEASAQELRVWLEKNHRGGKTACVIKGFVGPESELEALAKRLKNKCGTGGTAKDGEIIIQGDHREKIVASLLEWGFKAKKAGA